MELYQILEGDGQEIYVEKSLVKIPDEWVDEDNKRIVFPERLVGESNPVYETYKEMFINFYEKGYKVVTDSATVSDEAFFFTPCLDKHINEEREDYAQNKERKIKKELDKAGIEEPLIKRITEEGFTDALPLPFVLKNLAKQGGEEKYLIRTEEQLEILKRFYREINDYAKKKAIEYAKRDYPYDDEPVYDENGHCDNWLSIMFVDYQEYIQQNVIMQKYIKTPTKYNTSLRVMISTSGDVLVASLKYAQGGKEEEKKEKYYEMDKYLSDPSSPYYLKSEKVVSNTVAGGNSILLGEDNYTDLEREILEAHGIDPDNAEVPESIYTLVMSIALNCRREIGAICGLDFIYDDENKEWKYLEEHEYPMLYSYAQKHNLPYDEKAGDFYTVNELIDIDARLLALRLTMEKKKKISKKI